MKRAEKFLVSAAVLWFVVPLPATEPTTPSFADLAKQVQAQQARCQEASPSDRASCLKELSNTSGALYQAVVALTSQSIPDPNSPLAPFAKTELDRYQSIKSYIERNALEFMNGTAAIPDDWISGTSFAATTPPEPVPVPPAAPPAPLLGKALQGFGTVDGIATPQASVTVSVDKTPLPPVTAAADGGFSASLPDKQTWHSGQTLTAIQTVSNIPSSPSAERKVTTLRRNGLEFRAILGFQQAGASAAQSSLNWFNDIYFSNPLPIGPTTSTVKCSKDVPHCPDEGRQYFDPHWRWWGNIRVASYPQQGDVPVATFASNFIQEFGQVNVNKLVEGGEYTTGFEYRIANFGNKAPVGQSENSRQRFSLGFTGSIGATSPFSPQNSVSIFATPSKSSPQYMRFASTFPTAANSQYIAFLSPDRDQFFRQYFFGLRMTTHFADISDKGALLTAPAMASVSFGQNELVTGGRLHGVVMRAEGFYPLPIGKSADSGRNSAFSGIYLFGNVQMWLKRGQNIDPFILEPAASDVHAYDANVAQVTVPSNRDIYRIGIGIDLVSVINGLKQPPAQPPAKTATSTPTPTQ